MAGNRLGNRSKYLYTTDSGVNVRLNTDDDIATAGGLTITLPGSDAVTAPKGFKPRGVWIQSIAANPTIARKFIPCQADSPLYASDSPQNVSVDGEAFVSTGRVGEKQRFI